MVIKALFPGASRTATALGALPAAPEPAGARRVRYSGAGVFGIGWVLFKPGLQPGEDADFDIADE